MKTTDYIRQNNKSHIIFDLDGTICDILIDWNHWEQGLLELFYKYNQDPTKTLTNANLDQNHNVNKYGKKLLNELKHFIRDYELKNTTGFNPIAATLELINQTKHLNLFIWSANSELTITRALKNLGINELFIKCIGRESLIMQKPDPEGFKLIHQLNPNIPLSNYLFVGNAPNDYNAAVNAGIDYINVNEIII